jgi:hypothetical protein
MKKRGVQTRSIDKQQIFLRCYENAGSIKMACQAARIDRRQHYRWLKDVPDYFTQFQESEELAAQSIEDEAVERAMRGVFRPYTFQERPTYPQEEYVIRPAVLGKRGRVITPEVRGMRDVPGAQPLGIWEKSDQLLITLLKGFMRHKYGSLGSLEVSGPGGGDIEIVQRMQAARRRLALVAGESDAR